MILGWLCDLIFISTHFGFCLGQQGTPHPLHIWVRQNSKLKQTLGAGMTPRQGTTIAWGSFCLIHEISLGTKCMLQQELTHHLGYIGTHSHGLSIDASMLKFLGIPTPRNPYYQALAIFLVWQTPLSYPVKNIGDSCAKLLKVKCLMYVMKQK